MGGDQGADGCGRLVGLTPCSMSLQNVEMLSSMDSASVRIIKPFPAPQTPGRLQTTPVMPPAPSAPLAPSWTTSGWTPSRRTRARTHMPMRMALRRIPSQIAVQLPSHSRTLQTIQSPEVKRPRPSSCSVRTAWTARRPSASPQPRTGLSDFLDRVFFRDLTPNHCIFLVKIWEK